MEWSGPGETYRHSTYWFFGNRFLTIAEALFKYSSACSYFLVSRSSTVLPSIYFTSFCFGLFLFYMVFCRQRKRRKQGRTSQLPPAFLAVPVLSIPRKGIFNILTPFNLTASCFAVSCAIPVLCFVLKCCMMLFAVFTGGRQCCVPYPQRVDVDPD